MFRLPRVQAAVLVVFTSIALISCSSRVSIDNHQDSDSQAVPADLAGALMAEFERLGIDPDKVPAAAPQGEENRVFQITGVNVDPDGPVGPLPGTVVINWVERAIGDYDQNGEVSISDLTPLGALFHDTVSYRPPPVDGLDYWPTGDPLDDGGTTYPDPPVAGSPAENWRLARIDGDANGELNIADVTPIAQHWQERISGWRVYRQWFSEAEYTMLAASGAAYTYGRDQAYTYEGSQLDSSRTVGFVHTDVFIPGQAWERFYVAPYDEVTDDEGPASPVVQVMPDGTQRLLPVAILEADPAGGSPPLDVQWYAGASYDLDGTIAGFEWDTDDDGTFDLDTGATPSIDETYTADGPVTVTVRVTDDSGLTQTTSLTIQIGTGPGNQDPTAAFTVDVDEGWTPFYVTFDPTGSTDTDGTITELTWDFDGDDVIDRSDPTPTVFQHQYTVPGNYEVELTVADDGGASDSVSRTIAAHGWITTGITSVNMGLEGFSAALANGNPAAAWVQEDSSSLMYVHYSRAADEIGERWDAGIMSVYDCAYTGDGGSCSMAIINDRPAIGFIDSANGARFTRAEDDSGVNWPIVPEIVNPTNVIDYISLAVIDDRPALAWQGFSGILGDVYYCRANDVDGTSWPVRTEVCSGANDGNCLRMLGFDTGSGWIPAIAHRNDNQSYIKFDYGTDTDGSGWETQIDVTLPADSVGHMSMALVEGNLALAYMGDDSVAGDGLLYRTATYSDTTGFDWSSAPLLLPAEPTDGWDCSLAVINGYPAIAYRAQGTDTEFRLTYIRAEDSSGTTWGTPVTVEEDTVYDNGRNAVLLEIDGLPSIAHVQRIAYNQYSLRFSHGY